MDTSGFALLGNCHTGNTFLYLFLSTNHECMFFVCVCPFILELDLFLFLFIKQNTCIFYEVYYNLI